LTTVQYSGIVAVLDMLFLLSLAMKHGM